MAISFVLVLGVGYSAQGQNLYFVDRGDDNTITTCDPFTPNDCTLRGAIQRANTDGNTSQIQLGIPQSFGQTIILAFGTLSINNDQALLITSDPIISGNNGTNRRTVSGGFSVRVFSVSPGANVTFRNIGIQDGRFSAANDGAAIDNNQANVTVDNCGISNNASTDDAGAIKVTVGATLTVTNSEFFANASQTLGGAIFNQGTVSISNTLFRQNTSVGSAGGAIANAGTMTIRNSTFSGNTAAASGGGIYNLSGTLTVENSTITLNRADSTNVGATFGGGISQVSGVVNVGSSIISGNLNFAANGKDFSGTLTSLGYNIVGNTVGTTVTGQTFGNQLNVDPKLLPLRANGGSLLTHGLAANSPAIEKGSQISLPNLTTDNRGFPRRFDFTGIPDTNTGVDVGAFERQPRDYANIDFDLDNKTDISIFRPGPGEWWVLRSSNGSNFATQFGSSTDRLVPADFTGDGKADIAFWRPSNGNWFVLRSEDLTFFAFPFGANSDVPVPGDYDGDLKADAAVFRPSSNTWFINKSSGGTDIIGFGQAGDVPVVADYDGDGRTDIAINRTGQWWILRSSAGVIVYAFGAAGDRLVPGDFTGDGKADVALFRPSNGNWLVLRSEDASFFAFPFGTNGDIPVPGDYDGDGKTDAGVFRPSNSNWFINRSTAGTLIQQFGIANDIPTPSAYIP